MSTTVVKVPQSPARQFSPAQKILYALVRASLWWMPKASPDYDKRESNVAYWLVEVEDGRAEREIGFDAQGKPILHAPTDRNMGLWTDSDREFVVADYEAVAAAEFNQFWAVAS